MMMVQTRSDQVKVEGEVETCTAADLQSLITAGKRYGTIYADPPWPYDNQATRAATNNHYRTLSVERLADEIGALVKQLVADDAHLHLWTTNAFLFEAGRVMKAWGFAYKSVYVWVKPTIGLGNYWRVAHEFLLFGVRGRALFADRTLRSWGEFKRSEHSAKPEEIRRLIERASPRPRLELFARRPSPGWTVWGDANLSLENPTSHG